MSVIGLIRRFERRRRFWRLVDVGGPDDCWPWLGRTGPDGGVLSDGRPAVARAFELASGSRLPPHAAVEHRCGHAWCVNPHHLTVRAAAGRSRADRGAGVRGA